MADKKVRVRFAPSPTGGLHLGGVRTVLFNYLFAKKHGGDFVLRIEDTDQTRYVEGAEQYILDCLAWCGLTPDESPVAGGDYAPYRQSERKAIYREYAERLVRQGHAYYAFDTPEELERNRKEIPNFQYGQVYRDGLRNSISLKEHEVNELLDAGTPHVIRIKMPADERVSFTDMIRGHVSFETNQVDDKVLLKADGMPTYHLAVVVDDYLMNISHAFRGEEWLPSAPVHLLLWDYLGWKADMPQWAHLPLILKPDGHGKLSKRDGARLGFPVYAMNWFDAKTGELTPGFRELGFLPEAFLNLLATLGWNDGTDQEIFTLDELVAKFSIERVSKAGAKFDFEKAKWFNSEWIKRTSDVELEGIFRKQLEENHVPSEKIKDLQFIIGLIKDRLVYTTDLWRQSFYFFVPPTSHDIQSIKPKWSSEKNDFFNKLIVNFKGATHNNIQSIFQDLAKEINLKENDLLLPFRIMLVGGKFGPGVFSIAKFIDKQDIIDRIEIVLNKLAE